MLHCSKHSAIFSHFKSEPGQDAIISLQRPLSVFPTINNDVQKCDLLKIIVTSRKNEGNFMHGRHKTKYDRLNDANLKYTTILFRAQYLPRIPYWCQLNSALEYLAQIKQCEEIIRKYLSSVSSIPQLLLGCRNVIHR